MGIMTENHMTATEYANQRAAYYTPNQPFIKATEVLEETEKRCGAGQQYTTFQSRFPMRRKQRLKRKATRLLVTMFSPRTETVLLLLITVCISAFRLH